ncbi:protein cordon-bleu isoform X8 [Harpegnathos saltator]|uniref:protein cordon-bleu isoform X8 n=1 Tax=Harpegnathos saltator TaxID=610380 RepID=UPI000DBED847|nr:protein cordon-bleu isoform X8 [Harpegnathos saltator]
MLCLKKRRTYSFTQGACTALPRRSKKDNNNCYEGSLNMAITTLPRKNRSREERPSRMVLTVTEDTPADMLAGSMELLVQLPLDHHVHTQKVTVLRSTPMMDLLVQIATAHKLTASSYTLQAIGERGLVLPHHPNTPIGALDALQVKLLPKQGTCVPRKTKQTNQPFETTFRLQVHLPRNQLYVSRVSPKMNLGEILDEVCREKNLDRNKYELRHPANLEETLDLALSLQDYHLQEVTLYAKQARTLGPTLSTQDIMALQRQEERRRQQTKQSVFGFMFKKSKESSLSTDSLGGRSVSPARSDETGRSASPLQPPARPQRKRRPAPKPPTDAVAIDQDTSGQDGGKDKMVINHSRNSSDSSGYHEASVLSDNPDSAARLPETLPRRSKAPGMSDTPRKLAQTSQSSKSLGNLAVAATTAAAAAATMMTGGGTLTRGISSTSLSSTGLRKKRAAPPPPAPRPLSSAISTQALERIVDSEESLTSDMDPSKPPSDIGAPSKASSDIDCPKANSDIGISTQSMRQLDYKPKAEVSAAAEACKSAESDVPQQSVQPRPVKSDPVERKLLVKADPDVPVAPVEAAPRLEQARVAAKRATKDNSTPSETDILLQKVSDTLSNVLPSNSSSPEPSLQLERTNSVPMRKTNDVADMDTKLKPCNGSKDQSNEISKSSYVDFPADTLSSSTPNMTSNLQQDTSDYVSAMSEDLSISDWEYQLPAPPSAFRDSHSPVFDDYDTVTLGSVEAFKESLVTHPGLADTTDSCSKNDGSKKRKLKSLLNNVDANYNTTKATTEKIDSVPEAELNDDVKRATDKQTVAKQAPMSAAPKSEANADPRKEMISELENKIENGTLAQNIGKDLDRRNIDNVSAPKIAPVDNTLSNFTITTYTKQKNLDIFDEFEESDYVRNSDERFIKTFATLSRNNAGVGGHESKSAMRDMGRLTNGVSSHDSKVTVAGKNAEEPSASNVADCKTEPKIRNHDEPANNRWQCLSTTNNERANNVQRSKSYISTTNNAKYQTESQAMSERKHDPRSAEPPETAAMKKATSTSSLNVDAPRVNEKFSQWRDNILKRQEECTKEKQLQSLQVLKSILPQLKNAQQAEENVSKEYNNGLSIEKTKYEAGSNEHSSKTNVVLTRESRDTEATECRQPSREESTKRYTYAGPPAISLGSWSERPSVNVQIKMDTDYKLGRSNTSGNKTVVNINGAKEEKDIVNYTNNNISSKHHIAKHDIKIDSKNRDELSQKSLITHTMTLSGFKKPLSCRVNTSVDSIRTNEDRPVVTGVELKKSFVEVKETPRNVESEIDTTPVNFRELTKTFGQHVNFKLKPKRANINRHSADYHGAQLEETDAGVKQNGHGKFARMNNENESLPYKGQPLTSGAQQNCRLRKFTSVVGVNGTGQSFNQQNETVVLRSNVNNNAKINPLMPVVKGFKISVNDSKTGNGQLNQNGLSAIDGSKKNAQLPKPPTMPVITGVTLKSTSTRPKSMPAQMDPRDMLLESIRNFGGRDKLKSAAERF